MIWKRRLISTKTCSGCWNETRRKVPPRSGVGFYESAGKRRIDRALLFSGQRPVQVQTDLTHLAFEVDSLEEFGKHLAYKGL